MNIAARLAEVWQRIAAACAAAGRAPEEVQLVAVSKTKPVAAIRAAYAAGQRDFGENYAQDLQQKAAALSDLPELRWHFVGALQRNKAKFVVPVVHVLHGVDNPALIEKLQAQAERFDRRLKLLIQLNLSGEASKSGTDEAQLPELLAAIGRTDRLSCVGLMTLPDPAADPTPAFRQLRALRDRHGLRELSMGMSADLEAAIAQGATMVRVGTDIFGPREPRP